MEMKIQVYEGLKHLFDKIQHRGLLESRPLLAHYTSIESVEKIIKSSEIWLSNPLFMNDLEEMRYGMLKASEMFLSYVHDSYDQELIDTCKNNIGRHLNGFDTFYTLETYVFCLSEHDPSDADGRLSMWRAYADYGNGAALIFDTSVLNDQPASPLLLLKVQYGTHQERSSVLEDVIKDWFDFLCSPQNKDHARNMEFIDWCLYLIVNVFRTFALTWKHCGFQEEREWRLIYLPDRDGERHFENMKSYIVGRAGIEPKLKLVLQPIEGALGKEANLDQLTKQIILGPALSSDLSKNCFKQMLHGLGKGTLADRVTSSSIPLRHQYSRC